MAFIQMEYKSEALLRGTSIKVILPTDGMSGKWERPATVSCDLSGRNQYYKQYTIGMFLYILITPHTLVCHVTAA